jgi:membrane protein required for beta-lactamase induction
LIQHNENLLAVLFWFIVLGPMGAVIMRLSEQLHSQFAADVEHTALAFAAQRLYGILLWLPTHLAIAGFALGGSFTDTWQAWRTTNVYTGEEPERPWWSLAANRALLLIGGLSSVQVNKPAIEWEFVDLKAVLSLTSRSLIVWLVIIALLSLGGIIA